MEINKLKPYFDEDTLDKSFNKEQVDELYEQFQADFLDAPFEMEGKTIKLIQTKSRIKEYADYFETFTHIVTRKSDIVGQRLYDCNRANRVHWIKPILLAHPNKDIFYYRWKDVDGKCKHHYWCFAKDFMVVMVDIKPDLRIVTTFCVDKENKPFYYERYTDFKEGKDCL